MWCLGIWFSSGLGSVRLKVGLDDFKSLFQHKQSYNCVSLCLGGKSSTYAHPSKSQKTRWAFVDDIYMAHTT